MRVFRATFSVRERDIRACQARTADPAEPAHILETRLDPEAIRDALHGFHLTRFCPAAIAKVEQCRVKSINPQRVGRRGSGIKTTGANGQNFQSSLH